MSMVQRMAKEEMYKIVFHIGHNNTYCDYSMNGEILQSATEETGGAQWLSGRVLYSRPRASNTIYYCERIQKQYRHFQELHGVSITWSLNH